MTQNTNPDPTEQHQRIDTLAAEIVAEPGFSLETYLEESGWMSLFEHEAQREAIRNLGVLHADMQRLNDAFGQGRVPESRINRMAKEIVRMVEAQREIAE